MTPVVITDNDICQYISQTLAINAMRDAFVALHDRKLSAPPRIKSDLGDIQLDFTTGSLENTWFGYRSNGISQTKNSSEQVVVLNDIQSGEVTAVSVGHLLGPYRTGAIGAIAVDILATKEVNTVTIIGTGPQAWAQIWAISGIRKLNQVYIYSKNLHNRTAFANRVREELELNVQAVDEPENAVRESNIVVLATTSFEPVIRAEWINPGTHINTLGPKNISGSEMGDEVIDACTLICTDSPSQLEALYSDLMPSIKDRFSEIKSAADIYAGVNFNGRSANDISLFLSTGLAGTELFLLDALVKLIQSQDR